MNQLFGPACRQKLSRGFTLVELMIVVAIVGILASIAYPSYMEYMRKSNRAAAQSFMMDVAQRQQQYLMDARTYAGDLGTLGVTVPAEVSKFYVVSIGAVGATPPTFTVTATATGSQVKDGNLTLNQAGAKTPAEKW